MHILILMDGSLSCTVEKSVTLTGIPLIQSSSPEHGKEPFCKSSFISWSISTSKPRSLFTEKIHVRSNNAVLALGYKDVVLVFNVLHKLSANVKHLLDQTPGVLFLQSIKLKFLEIKDSCWSHCWRLIRSGALERNLQTGLWKSFKKLSKHCRLASSRRAHDKHLLKVIWDSVRKFLVVWPRIDTIKVPTDETKLSLMPRRHLRNIYWSFWFIDHLL